MDIRIKEVVKAHGMTLQEVCDKCGYKSLPSFYRQINNPESLSMKTLIKVATAIGCEVNDFFREPQEPNNSIVCPHCGAYIYLHPSTTENLTEAK